MADEIEFPKRNLNPGAEPWGRAIEKTALDLETQLSRVLQTVESQGRTLQGLKGPATDADGTIYRPNGIVVPTAGSGLIYASGTDGDGNPISLVTGRTQATPFTLYFGEYEDDAAGSFSALQVDPESLYLRSNMIEHGGYSAVMALQGGAVGTQGGDSSSGGSSSDGGFSGYLTTPGLFAVEFGTTQNTSIDYSFGLSPWDASADHWAIRYLAGRGDYDSGGTATYLSLADGLFEVAYEASTEEGSDGADYGFAFKNYLRAYAVRDDDGNIVRTLALADGVVLDGWGTSSGGGGGGGSADVPDASTTVKGIIRIATNGEASDGLIAGVAITPAQLKAYVLANAGSGGGGGGTAYNLADHYSGEWSATTTGAYSTLTEAFVGTESALPSGMTIDTTGGGTIAVQDASDFHAQMPPNSTATGDNAAVFTGGPGSPVLRWEFDMPVDGLITWVVSIATGSLFSYRRNDQLWDQYGTTEPTGWEGNGSEPLPAGHWVLTFALTGDPDVAWSMGMSGMTVQTPVPATESAYARGDLVSHNGFLWLCEVTATVATPGDESGDWQAIAVFTEQDTGGGGGGGTTVVAATHDVSGILQLATVDETTAFTDDSTAVTPLDLGTWWQSTPQASALLLPFAPVDGQVLTGANGGWQAVTPATATDDELDLPVSASPGQYLAWNGSAWVAKNLPTSAGGSGDTGSVPEATTYRGQYQTVTHIYESQLIYIWKTSPYDISKINGSRVQTIDPAVIGDSLGTPPADFGQNLDPPDSGPYILQMSPTYAAAASWSQVAEFTRSTGDDGSGTVYLGSSVGFDYAITGKAAKLIVYVDGQEVWRAADSGTLPTPTNWTHVTIQIDAGKKQVQFVAIAGSNTSRAYMDNVSFNLVNLPYQDPGTYQRNDVVDYGGQQYIALETTSTNPPTDGSTTADWAPFVPSVPDPESGSGDIPYADQSTPGIVRFATDIEALGGGDATTAISPETLNTVLGQHTFDSATDTEAGIVRLATADEATAGTDTSTAMTPAEVKAAVAAGAYTLLQGWKGTYDPTTTYGPGDLVRWNGALVLALDVVQGTAPPTALPDTAYWAVVVATPPVSTGGGTGGGNGPFVVGPSNSLTMPGLWIETDNLGNFVQWWYDDNDGVGGSNTNGDVSFGPTNGLQVAGLWIETDENLVPQMLVYDDGNH